METVTFTTVLEGNDPNIVESMVLNTEHDANNTTGIYDNIQHIRLENEYIQPKHSPPDDGSGGVTKVRRSRTLYTCLVCLKVFHQNSNLERHQLVHTQKKPYTCEECGKSFTQAAHLKRHIKLRMKRPHFCILCCKSFHWPQDLVNHTASHDGKPREYLCSFCDKIFNKSSHLQQHLLVHSDEKPFTCLVCDHMLKSKNSLFHHMLIHANTEINGCRDCLENFQTLDELKKHLRMKHTIDKQTDAPALAPGDELIVEKIQSEISQEVTNQPNPVPTSVPIETRIAADVDNLSQIPDVDTIASSIVITTEPIKDAGTSSAGNPPQMSVIIYQYIADEGSVEQTWSAEDISTCQTLEIQEQPLQEQADIQTVYKMEEYTDVQTVCEEQEQVVVIQPSSQNENEVKCFENQFENDDMVEFVEYSPLRIKEFRCEICCRTFKHVGSLKRHVRTHLPEERPYACELCDKRFNQAVHVTQHMLTHSKVKEFSCAHCRRAFSRLSHLRLHVQTHSGEQREKPHKCNFCDKSFVERKRLHDHLNCHYGKKPYACELCEKSFTHEMYLKQHLLVHDGTKTHVCSRCNKAFLTATGLARHMRSHAEMRRYACTTCGKAFKQASDLSRHCKIHTGVRPHACTVAGCGKSFLIRGALRIHMETHSDNTVHLCLFPGCKQEFKKDSTLKAHIRKHKKGFIAIADNPKKRVTNTEFVSNVDTEENPESGNSENINTNSETGNLAVEGKEPGIKIKLESVGQENIQLEVQI